jgi:diguanylate cyclase (GGDEF)-like protein
MFAESHRYSHDLSCVMLDLDHYKQLNDTLGHQVGDQLLVMAGKVIAANMRRMDVAARYGGDEFVLLIPHATGEAAAAVAERIRLEYRQSSAALLRAGSEGVNMSVGVASARCVAAASSEQLLARADAALYRSKELGRNRITIAETPAATGLPAAAGSQTLSVPAA